MKITFATLLALTVAMPVAVVQALDLTLNINSTLPEGTMTLFPEKNFVTLNHKHGEYPQHVGQLHFANLGSGEQHFERFDIIDTRLGGHETGGKYYNCKLWAVKDSGVPEETVLTMSGALPGTGGTNVMMRVGDDEGRGRGSEIRVDCKWTDNGQ